MISAGRLGAKNGNFSIRPMAAGGIPIPSPYAWLSAFFHARLATVLAACLCQVPGTGEGAAGFGIILITI